MKDWKWRLIFILAGLVLGAALCFAVLGRRDIAGLIGALGLVVTAGGMGSAGKAHKAEEKKRLDDEVEAARLLAEEEARAKIIIGGPDSTAHILSLESRERIAQAGRDAVSRVLERHGRKPKT